MSIRLAQPVQRFAALLLTMSVILGAKPAAGYETEAARLHKARVASLNEFLKLYKSSKDTFDFVERAKDRVSPATYELLKAVAKESGSKKLARVERRSDLELVFFENGKVARYVVLDGAPGRAMVNNKLVEVSGSKSAVEYWNSLTTVLPRSSSFGLWSLFAADAQAQVGAAAGAVEAAGAAAAPVVKSFGSRIIGAVTSTPGKLAAGSMTSAGMAMTYNQLSDTFGDKCKALRTAMTACADAQQTLDTRSRMWASSRARKEVKYKRAMDKYNAAKAKGEDPDPVDDIGGIENEDGYLDAASKVVNALGEIHKALYDDKGIAAQLTRNKDIQCDASPIVKDTEICKIKLMDAAAELKMSVPGFSKTRPSEDGSAAPAPAPASSGPAIR